MTEKEYDSIMCAIENAGYIISGAASVFRIGIQHCEDKDEVATAFDGFVGMARVYIESKVKERADLLLAIKKSAEKSERD